MRRLNCFVVKVAASFISANNYEIIMAKKKIKGGATIWARQTIHSDIFYWKPDKWFKIWFYIVNQMNHKNNKLFKRGDNFITYREIQEATGAKRNSIDHCIRYLKSATMIATRKTTRGMIITVNRYHFFQTMSNYYYKKSDTKSDLEAIQKRYRSDTINKNDINKKKRDKSIRIDLSLIREEPKKDIKIIYLYAYKKSIKTFNKDTKKSFITRNIRAAQLLKGYSVKRIGEVMNYLEENADFKWTLETVGKFIDENLEKLTKGQVKTLSM